MPLGLTWHQEEGRWGFPSVALAIVGRRKRGWELGQCSVPQSPLSGLQLGEGQVGDIIQALCKGMEPIHSKYPRQTGWC